MSLTNIVHEASFLKSSFYSHTKLLDDNRAVFTVYTYKWLFPGNDFGKYVILRKPCATLRALNTPRLMPPSRAAPYEQETVLQHTAVSSSAGRKEVMSKTAHRHAV